jgi:hypothetical protein
MNARTFVSVLILGGFCLLTGSASVLLANENATTTLSFDGLGNDQAIRFFVSAEHTSFSVAPVRFEVEVSGQSQVKIRMWINASMRIPEAEREWGHHVNEPVTRALQPGDVQTLQNFLAAHRARGSLPTRGSEFDLVTYRPNKEGINHADIDKKEFYNPVSAAERKDFVKNFIGFKG